MDLDLTLHKTRVRGFFELGDTRFTVIKNTRDRLGGKLPRTSQTWRISPGLANGGWIERNQGLFDIDFPTRRALIDCLCAVLASDPLPDEYQRNTPGVVPVRLVSTGPGRYDILVLDGSGTTGKLSRSLSTLGWWSVTTLGGSSMGQYPSLREVRRFAGAMLTCSD